MWSFDELQEKLEAISKFEANFQAAQDENLTEAAVLVPMVIRNGVPSLVLTVRTMNLSRYAGDVSFPGGKRDPEDRSLVHTALRETREEIGLNKDRITVLGSLLPFVTRERIQVWPVLAKIVDFESFHPKLNTFEVSEMLVVPLENFIKKECHKCRHTTFEGTDVYFDLFEFAHNSKVHVVWGLTAMISTIVASLFFNRIPQFEYQDWVYKSSKNNYAKVIHESFIKSRL